MSRYDDQVLDDYQRPVPGVSVYVFDDDGVLDTLTDDLAAPLDNPVTTDADGRFYFNAADGEKTLDFRFGGRTRYKQDIALGSIPDPLLRDDLAEPDGSAMSGFAQAEGSAAARTARDKLRETISAADFTGANDTAIINAAIAAAVARGVNARVYLDRAYTVTALTNPYGIAFHGPGRIQKAITGGNQQLTTYADAPGRIVIGREYMFRALFRAMQGQAGASGNMGIVMAGDSTVASPGYLSDTPQQLLTKLMEIRGVGNVTVTNLGVAGTKVSDMNVIPSLGPTTDLLIIKYGINDGVNPDATRLATFQSAFDAKLAAIRADPDGGIGGLSILLVGPNATADTSNGRDERWYEQLRGVYVELARKYQCCYIDTYAAFKDARGGENLWLDSLGVHPAESLGSQIWALIADTIITRDEAVRLGTSNFRNLASNVYAPTNAALPSQWPMGIVVARAQSGSGFPLDGFVISVRAPELGVIQRLFPYAANNSRCLTRTANVGADTFNRWTGVAENLTLQNGWANFGAPFANASAIMLESGTVQVQGVIAGGTTAANTLLATLPAGMRPASDLLFECAGNTARVIVKVQTNGEIRLQTAGDAVFTSLSNIHFLAA